MTAAAKAWAQFSELSRDFTQITAPRAPFRDLHAFMLLAALAKPFEDIALYGMVSACEHNVIYLNVSPSEVAANASTEQIRELVLCGVRYDEDTDSLYMNV